MDSEIFHNSFLYIIAIFKKQLHLPTYTLDEVPILTYLIGKGVEIIQLLMCYFYIFKLECLIL